MQYDNAPSHRAAIVTEFKVKNRIKSDVARIMQKEWGLS